MGRGATSWDHYAILLPKRIAHKFCPFTLPFYLYKSVPAVYPSQLTNGQGRYFLGSLCNPVTQKNSTQILPIYPPLLSLQNCPCRISLPAHKWAGALLPGIIMQSCYPKE